MNILCKYEEKIKVRFLFICVLKKKIHVLCATLWKWARWGHYNLYFEALKGLLLKTAP